MAKFNKWVEVDVFSYKMEVEGGFLYRFGDSTDDSYIVFVPVRKE
jgi:hypothetical protein